MKKTRELIAENLKLVDLVLEVLDARIPISSRNPIINELLGNKPGIIILNKSDLADEAATAACLRRLSDENSNYVLAMNSNSGEGVKSLMALLEKIKNERDAASQRKRPLRLMIVGVPNVGKSSLINRLVGKKSAKIGNRPGVTRGKQWLSLASGIMLLDTPGILWPKFEDPEVGLRLAFCGAIKDEIMDLPTLGMELTGRLSELYPELLCARYKIENVEETPLKTMEAIALKRGFILPGKRIDYERCARTVIDEFRSGIIGRITLERCE
jgi:ribosome biogenesis GTPase A